MCFMSTPKTPAPPASPGKSAADVQGTAPENPTSNNDVQAARRNGRSSLRIDLGGMPASSGLNIPTS